MPLLAHVHHAGRVGIDRLVEAAVKDGGRRHRHVVIAVSVEIPHRQGIGHALVIADPRAQTDAARAARHADKRRAAAPAGAVKRIGDRLYAAVGLVGQQHDDFIPSVPVDIAGSDLHQVDQIVGLLDENQRRKVLADIDPGDGELARPAMVGVAHAESILPNGPDRVCDEQRHLVGFAVAGKVPLHRHPAVGRDSGRVPAPGRACDVFNVPLVPRFPLVAVHIRLHSSAVILQRIQLIDGEHIRVFPIGAQGIRAIVLIVGPAFVKAEAVKNVAGGILRHFLCRC